MPTVTTPEVELTEEEIAKLPQLKRERGTPTPATAEQARILEQMQEWQQRAGVTNDKLAEFARMNPGTLSKVFRHKYEGDVSAMINKLKAAIQRLSASLKAELQFKARSFYVSAGFNRLSEALVSADAFAQMQIPERGVMVLGEAGIGKTAIAREAMRLRNEGLLISARPSWKTSYRGVLEDFATALGGIEARSINELERLVLTKLQASCITVFIEELSPKNVSVRLLELLKTILNQTKSTVVMFAIPSFAVEIGRLEHGEESTQLFRRMRQIRLTVERPIVEAMLSEAVSGAPKAVTDTLIARLGQPQSGGYGTLRIFCDLAKKETETLTPTAADQLLTEAFGQWQPG